MKRYGNLYEKICSMDNLYLAFQHAKKGNRRAGALGRTRERTTPPPCEAETAFIIGKVTHRYDDPFKQAAYIYSLIESEVRNG